MGSLRHGLYPVDSPCLRFQPRGPDAYLARRPRLQARCHREHLLLRRDFLQPVRRSRSPSARATPTCHQKTTAPTKPAPSGISGAAAWHPARRALPTPRRPTPVSPIPPTPCLTVLAAPARQWRQCRSPRPHDQPVGSACPAMPISRARSRPRASTRPPSGTRWPMFPRQHVQLLEQLPSAPPFRCRRRAVTTSRVANASSTVPLDPATGLVKQVPGYWVFNAMLEPSAQRTHRRCSQCL